MKLLKTVLFIFAVAMICSCSEELAVSPNLMGIQEDCTSSSFTDVNQIKDNLIGKWQMIEHGCGECIELSSIEGEVEFNNSIGHLEFMSDGVITELDFVWSLKVVEDIFGDLKITLETQPFHYGLRFNVFCAAYMYRDDRPIDGQYFLYQKQ